MEAIRKTVTRYAGLSVILMFAASIMAGNQVTRAVDDSGGDAQITMSPTSTRLALTPGETFAGELTVINSGKAAYDFGVSSAPYSVTNEAYNPSFAGDTTHTQISKWVSFEKPTYHAEAGETVKVPYEIKPPRDTPEGGQYAVLFAETTGGTQQTAQGAITTKKRVGMLVYGAVGGKTRAAGSVSMNKANFWQLNGKVSANARLENTGNADYQAMFDYTVKDIFGNTQYNTKVTKVVLPDAPRVVSVTWESPAPIGLYKVQQDIHYLDQTNSSSQWVIVATPLSLVVLGVVILAIIGAIIYVVRRKKN